MKHFDNHVLLQEGWRGKQKDLLGSDFFLHVSSHFFFSLCKVAAPIFAFNFGTKLRWRKNERCDALDIQWPTAGLACTCSWETWLKDSKECESVSVRGFVYVNTHSCSQGSYSLQTDAIDTQTSALTCFVSKLCKVTFNLGAHFIFSRTLRN